jgi:murein DD-endopeptidase MepM/ murein hydrolase activator NlpD
MMLDSLRREIDQRDQYLAQIQAVISGNVIEDTTVGSVDEFEGVTMSPMQNDSIFSELIGPDKYKFSYNNEGEGSSELSRMSLFPPLMGLIVNKYDAFSGHYGVDVVGREFSHVVSVLDGTVIFAEWSVTTGYVVEVQHAQNLISIYKHNSDIQVKPGDHVSAGDLIAIMGNEGEYSTGPHLHFELWQNGVPLDPENYILF